eukprot:COSAG01_NODE_1017_length_12107_cov_114.566372_10_plen_77_part_00
MYAAASGFGLAHVPENLGPSEGNSQASEAMPGGMGGFAMGEYTAIRQQGMGQPALEVRPFGQLPVVTEILPVWRPF